MASPESPHSPVDQFYVLKQGGMHGPFTREELRERFRGGHLDMEDFVQMEGVPIWQPLARILGNEDTVPHGAIAPDWKSLMTWAWLRLRYDLDEQSVVAAEQSTHQNWQTIANSKSDVGWLEPIGFVGSKTERAVGKSRAVSTDRHLGFRLSRR